MALLVPKMVSETGTFCSSLSVAFVPECSTYINLLKPRNYFTYCTTRFNIKKLYVILPLRLCVLYGSENKQRLLPYTTLAVWFCITEVKGVYCAVGIESLYKTDLFRL